MSTHYILYTVYGNVIILIIIINAFKIYWMYRVNLDLSSSCGVLVRCCCTLCAVRRVRAHPHPPPTIHTSIHIHPPPVQKARAAISLGTSSMLRINISISSSHSLLHTQAHSSRMHIGSGQSMADPRSPKVRPNGEAAPSAAQPPSSQPQSRHRARLHQAMLVLRYGWIPDEGSRLTERETPGA